MDLEELLRQKTEGVVNEFINIAAGDLEQKIKQLLENNVTDPKLLEPLLKEFTSIIYPARVKQIEQQLAEGLAGKRVLAVCDMVGVPYSFDILVFLFVANRFRVEQGGDVLDVAFVAHASDPGIVDQEIQANIKSRYRSLIHNLGIQATQMLSCIGNIHFSIIVKCSSTILMVSKSK